MTGWAEKQGAEGWRRRAEGPKRCRRGMEGLGQGKRGPEEQGQAALLAAAEAGPAEAGPREGAAMKRGEAGRRGRGGGRRLRRPRPRPLGAGAQCCRRCRYSCVASIFRDVQKWRTGKSAECASQAHVSGPGAGEWERRQTPSAQCMTAEQLTCCKNRPVSRLPIPIARHPHAPTQGCVSTWCIHKEKFKRISPRQPAAYSYCSTPPRSHGRMCEHMVHPQGEVQKNSHGMDQPTYKIWARSEATKHQTQ
jgi:hypothetical protein